MYALLIENDCSDLLLLHSKLAFDLIRGRDEGLSVDEDTLLDRIVCVGEGDMACVCAGVMERREHVINVEFEGVLARFGLQDVLVKCGSHPIKRHGGRDDDECRWGWVE